VFSQALLYRINVVPVNLPPLRERQGDILLLVEHFLDQAQAMAGVRRRFSSRALDCLERYAWPGNVRELSHLVQRMVALTSGDEIKVRDLPPAICQILGNSQDSGLNQKLAATQGIPRKRRHGLASFLAAHRGQTVSNADLRNALSCSDSTAKNLFKALSRAGLVEAKGHKGGRRYMVG
jgi:DNA-binding NtrC family response regulator